MHGGSSRILTCLKFYNISFLSLDIRLLDCSSSILLYILAGAGGLHYFMIPLLADRVH